jgi:flagellar hook-associated protein 1 FlgK
MGSPASKTYTEFYDTLRLRISTATATAQQSELDEQTMQTQVSALASGVSGVSTDDEAIDMIQFQRAFEASSRVVNVVDELLQTILGMAG